MTINSLTDVQMEIEQISTELNVMRNNLRELNNAIGEITECDMSLSINSANLTNRVQAIREYLTGYKR